MTQPERQAATGTLEAWDELFRCASVDERRRLLDAAGPTGVLYAHRLSVLGNGHAKARRLSVLESLSVGEMPALEPMIADVCRAVQSTDLDESQRQAVALGLQTPDIALIEGGPGCGKSRVVAETLVAGVKAGLRMLLVAPNAIAVDHVLQRISGQSDIFAIRLLEGQENSAALPATIQALTLTPRAAEFQRDVLGRSRAEMAQLRVLLDGAGTRETEWQRLREFVEQQTEMTVRRAELATRSCTQLAQAEREAEAIRTGTDDSQEGSFAAAIRVNTSCLEAAVQKTAKNRADQQVTCAEKQRAIEATRVLQQRLSGFLDVRARKRWWTPSWWRALFHGNCSAEHAVATERLKALEGEVVALQEACDQAARELESLRTVTAARDREIIEAEAGSRRALIDQQIAALDDRLEQLAQARRELCERLEVPGDVSTHRLMEAQRVWLESCSKDRKRLEELTQWVTSVENDLPSLPQRLVRHANVVAGTLGSLNTTDLGAEDKANDSPRYDLVIVDDAHLADAAEIHRAARLANRCVLVGEATPATCKSFFGRAWQTLHADPRHLPYAWLQDKKRLCCRLRQVSGGDRRWLETEHLADSSGIELRILTAPGTAPQLAEIDFPPTTDIAHAKAFVLNELQELAIAADGHAVQWLEQEQQLTLQLADTPISGGVTITLAPGVREVVQLVEGGHGATNGTMHERWRTCCLEFDRGAGWHVERARHWLRQASGLCDLGRTVRLRHCHRMPVGMSHILADWMGLPHILAGNGTACKSQKVPVEFVPVPPLPRARPERPDRSRRLGRHESPPPRPAELILPRAGAGLELDLSDPRQHERLPRELRRGLPQHGFVNYLEAQSIVRMLPTLADRNCCRSAAIIALDAAQAALVRNLLELEKASIGTVAVGTPETFRHQEFDIVLVSMTRSHSHRPVYYGDALDLALTRARHRLVLFADPGTIWRRTQWSGAVEHQDEKKSTGERDFLMRMLPYLQGQGHHARWFCLGQGAGA